MRLVGFIRSTERGAFSRLSQCSAAASPPASAANSPAGICAAPRAAAREPGRRGGRACLRNRIRCGREKVLGLALLACCIAFFAACVTLPAFFAVNSAPLLGKYGIVNLVFGREWNPDKQLYGLLPMLVSTLYLTALSAALSLPLGTMCAVFVHCYCTGNIKRTMRSLLGAAAAVPSVIFGLFGLSVIFPLMESLGLSGHSALSAAILLCVMTLPTTVTLCLDALDSVPPEMREASCALGASREYAAATVELFCAKKELAAAYSLSCARAVAEATAILMISGNQPLLPSSPLSGVRTLCEHILLEIGYATGEHRMALMASALPLCAISAALCAAKLLPNRTR